MLELMDNVVLTPHVAGITHQAQDRILGVLAADLETLFRGEEANHAVGSLRRISDPVRDKNTTP
jgi:phosphoglycerate dehydrogenase-like enzyme